MRRGLPLFIVALLFCGATASAQQIGSTTTINAQDAGSCATSGACATFTVPTSQTQVGFQVSGFGSATLTLEGTMDGTNWLGMSCTNLVDLSSIASVTANAQFVCPNAGFASMRLRGGTYASGTILVTAMRGYGVARIAQPLFTNVTLSAAGSLSWTGRGVVKSPADGKFTFSNAAATAGFCLDASTNSTAAFSASDCASAANITATGNVQAAGGGSLGFASRGKFLSNADGKIQASNNGGTVKTTIQVTGIPTCSSNCGTSPSVVGSDSSMIVTMGASGSPASGWVITFNGTWAAAPSCHGQMGLATMANTKLPIVIVTTTTTATVTTNGVAPANGDVYHIGCLGVQ